MPPAELALASRSGGLARRRVLRDPPEILLTTPESLEAMVREAKAALEAEAKAAAETKVKAGQEAEEKRKREGRGKSGKKAKARLGEPEAKANATSPIPIAASCWPRMAIFRATMRRSRDPRKGRLSGLPRRRHQGGQLSGEAPSSFEDLPSAHCL